MTAESGRQRRDRRGAIVEAGYVCLATRGYERTTTAEVCRRAGVSSGTFFHYFPTKRALLVAVLSEGLERSTATMDQIRAVDDPWHAVVRWCDHVMTEAADAHLAGFSAVVGDAAGEPEVAALLHADADLVRSTLAAVIGAGQRHGTMRNDRSADRLAFWLQILSDGLLAHTITGGAGDSEDLTAEFADAVARLLR